MEFLGSPNWFRLCSNLLCLFWLLLTTSACTQAFSKNHVASIPLVMLHEVPIPNVVKQQEAGEQTMSHDSAFSVWFLGAEGWESDATAQAMSNPAMLRDTESYFEAQFESLFLSIITLNFESVTMRGRWVRMVPQDLPPINQEAILDSRLPASSSEKKRP